MLSAVLLNTLSGYSFFSLAVCLLIDMTERAFNVSCQIRQPSGLNEVVSQLGYALRTWYLIHSKSDKIFFKLVLQ